MKKITILTLHGMGETRKDYWTDLAGKFKSGLETEVWQSLHIEPIYYQSLMQKNQDELWRHLSSAHSLQWQSFRKFVLFGFGDAACLEHQAYLEKSVYIQVQGIIRDAIKRALAHMESTACPVIVVAQSLGCHVISNYIWDAQQEQGIWQHYPHTGDKAEADFLKLKQTRYLFTTGCNIPLFVSGQRQIEAIARPNAAFEWFNYFDVDDVLGWPLKQLSDSYRQIITEDVKIDSGNFLQNWNPSSHNGYWTDEDFVQPVVNKIQALHKQLHTPGLRLEEKGSSKRLRTAALAHSSKRAWVDSTTLCHCRLPYN